MGFNQLAGRSVCIGLELSRRDVAEDAVEAFGVEPAPQRLHTTSCVAIRLIVPCSWAVLPGRAPRAAASPGEPRALNSGVDRRVVGLL